MKVKCSRGQLHEAFTIASMVVPQRTTIPAITSVKLTAHKEKGGGTLEIACTDLEFGLKLTIPATEVKEEGTLVLPAARMAGILREAFEKVFAPMGLEIGAELPEEIAISVVAEMIAVRRAPDTDWRQLSKSIFAHDRLKALLK